MAKPDTQEKYKNLKRATLASGLAAIFIFIVESFVLGAPMFTVFVLIYVVIYLFPVTLFSIRNKPKLKFFGYKLVIYTLLVISSLGFHSYDISLARQRAETIITAVNQYQQDMGQYPASLEKLVPAYMPEIPKPRIAPGVFYYHCAPEDTFLMYADYPPFGRQSWSFNNREWTSLD
jgi:hypothetical protein